MIDGQENPISVIYGAKLIEAGQKYLTLSRHVYSALVFVANKAFMDSLPDDQRKLVMECARSASLKGRTNIRDNEAKQIEELKAAGMQVEENPDIEAFRKATAPVLDSATGETKKLVVQIQEAVK